jgi:mono/diheme cytochrome c family protein
MSVKVRLVMARYAHFGIGCIGLFALVVGMTVEPAAQPRTTPLVVNRPYSAIVSIAGKDNFDAYCAVCHGSDAKGNGPAAPAMKAPVPDLTRIAARHGGKFDRPAVEYIIRGTGKMATPAHGVQDMPIWGYVFDPNLRETEVTTLRVNNLVTYLESIQERKDR